MIGTEVGVDEQGNATVELPRPFSTAPRTATLARAEAPEAKPAAPAATPEPAKVDVDQIAETVIDSFAASCSSSVSRPVGGWT